MAIFTTQDLQIILAGNVDLSTANPLTIRYEKPDGTTTGEISATAGGTGNLSAIGDFTPAILDQTGNWQLQYIATISSKVYPSTFANLFVKTVITDPTP